MGILKSKIRELLSKLAGVISDYKLSIASSVLFSIFGAILIILEYDFDISIPYEETIFRFFIFFEFGLVFVETCFKNWKWQKVVGIVLSAFIAGLTASCIGMDESISLFGISGAIWREKAQQLGPGYVLLLTILIVYFCYRKTEIKFEKYLTKIFFNFILTFSFYIMLSIAVGLVCGVVDTLILKGSSNITLASEVLITGLFLAPGCILALNNTEGASEYSLLYSSECKGLIKYIFTIPTMCVLVIAYLYIFKIIFLWELPSNDIFPILSILFCIGMPIWIMAQCWIDESKYSRIVSFLPYIFAPLILMQILSMGIRIGANGLTPGRYAGVMLIIFEIGTLLIWHFNKNRLEKIMLLMSVLVAVAFFAPMVNMYRLSSIWQESWFQKYYEMSVSGEMLSERDRDRLKGAYQYLEREAHFSNIIEQYGIDQDSLSEELDKQLTQRQYKRYYIHGCQMVGELDVQGFATMNMADKADCNVTYNENQEPEVNFSSFTFTIRETGERITVDISDFVEKFMCYIEEHPDADEDEQSEYMRSFNRIVIDQNRVLYINHFEVTYEKGIKDGEEYFKWKSIATIGGMLLQK